MLQDIAPYKYDVTYRTEAAENDDMMLIFRGVELLHKIEHGEIIYPTVEELAQVFPQVKEKAKFMFRVDDTDFYEIRNHEIEPFDGWEYITKADLRTLKPTWGVFVAATGFQIHDWYTNHQFCGRCGSNMEAPGNERAMKCPKCGRVHYPQICPSVIVGVTDGDKLLMTKYSVKHSAYRRYALVAGYAEVGESLEDTVIREVREEVGLEVENIRYYASQPWSYTDTLLAGFFCDVSGSREITMDENELSVAEWLTREEIPEDVADDSVSLTGAMMKAFKEGRA